MALERTRDGLKELARGYRAAHDREPDPDSMAAQHLRSMAYGMEIAVKYLDIMIQELEQ